MTFDYRKFIISVMEAQGVLIEGRYPIDIITEGFRITSVSSFDWGSNLECNDKKWSAGDNEALMIVDGAFTCIKHKDLIVALVFGGDVVHFGIIPVEEYNPDTIDLSTIQIEHKGRGTGIAFVAIFNRLMSLILDRLINSRLPAISFTPANSDLLSLYHRAIKSSEIKQELMKYKIKPMFSPTTKVFYLQKTNEPI